MVVSRTPDHDDAGSGAFHRKESVSALANGMRLKTETASLYSDVAPLTRPWMVSTRRESSSEVVRGSKAAQLTAMLLAMMLARRRSSIMLVT